MIFARYVGCNIIIIMNNKMLVLHFKLIWFLLLMQSYTNTMNRTEKNWKHLIHKKKTQSSYLPTV